MRHLRSALKDQFGRRMCPQINRAQSEANISISIRRERFRLPDIHLQAMQKQHADVCRIKDDNIFFEGDRESVLSCTQDIATKEKDCTSRKNGSRSNRRRFSTVR